MSRDLLLRVMDAKPIMFFFILINERKTAMKQLTKLFQKEKAALTIDEAAKFIKTSPEALAAFESAYASVETKAEAQHTPSHCTKSQMHDTIVDDLVSKTVTYQYNGKSASIKTYDRPLGASERITPEMIASLPKDERPQLTGNLMKIDIPDSGLALLKNLKYYLETGNRNFYHLFRQGLDILDLDPITYQMLDQNPNAMGYWLPRLVQANNEQDFFKIPKTIVTKVPITMLQLTRNDFGNLTDATKSIVNDWAMRVFELDDTKDHFVKTGTYSSKFDFRNAHVPAGQETHELGEYLLFIHYMALQMASPLSKPCIYGVSTTNEWVVREYIKPKDNDTTIYHGLPLHTEYRVFVDCDTDEVLGIHNYWDPDVMNKRFAEMRSLDDVHDAVTYKANQERLCARYEAHKDSVASHIRDILPFLDLTGQWSIDVMQNGDDFYLIDMAMAENSAFYKDVVAPELRRPTPEDWMPRLPE